MALTVTLVRQEATPTGKDSIIEVTYDAAYASGGEPLDLTAAPLDGEHAYTTVDSVTLLEGPYNSAGAPIARTLCSNVRYDFATSRAPASGLLFADAEDGTSGVTAEASGDLSTVICRLLVKGR